MGAKFGGEPAQTFVIPPMQVMKPTEPVDSVTTSKTVKGAALPSTHSDVSTIGAKPPPVVISSNVAHARSTELNFGDCNQEHNDNAVESTTNEPRLSYAAALPGSGPKRPRDTGFESDGSDETIPITSIEPSSPVAKPKRCRVSTEQLAVLMQSYDEEPLPSVERRQALAKELNLNARSLQIWFQNRRQRQKAMAAKGSSDADSCDASAALAASQLVAGSRVEGVGNDEGDQGDGLLLLLACAN